MKAHRRNGIPTLMLQEGGEATSSAFGRFFTPSQKEYENRERQKFIAALTRSTPSIFTQQTPAEQKLRVPTRDLSRDLRIRTQGGLNSLTGSDYASTISEYYDRSLAPNIDPGIRGILKKEYDRVVLPRMRVRQGSIAAAQAAGSPLEDDIVRLAEISEADRQEQEGLAGTAATPIETATTPAETATTPAETAATSAETAATSAATVAPEGPEKEALRQATGAPTQAEEAAATAATPTGTAAEQPIAIEPDDSVAGKLNKVLLGDGAKFDDTERLKQLKETFGLNLSDMERSAPALAFSFALMGATKEPGESPLQAFIRNAGTAGQSALAQQQALDAKQRSIDAALISPILTERRAAETIERDKEWVTYWDGTTGDGLPNFKSTKMNARQIEEAQKAGVNLVPLGLAGDYISQSAAVQRATKDAGVKLQELLMKEEKERSAAVAGTVLEVGEGSDQRSVRQVMVLVNGKPSPALFNADPGKSFDRNSMAVNQTVQSVGLVRDMKKSVEDGALGAEGAISYVYGGIKDFFVGGKGFTLDQTVGALRSAGGVEGDLVWRNDDPAAQSLLERNMGEAYNKELSATENYRRYVESTAVFANVTEDQINKLRADAANVADADKRSRYEARIDYLINQRSLAAALAPLLLGESGRTISDADRIRVIQLMGEFADSSKAGLSARPTAAMKALNNLESILTQNANKFAKSIQTEAEELDFASKAQVHLGKKGDRAYVMTEPVRKSLDRANRSLNAYEKLFSPSGASSADQNAPPSVYGGPVSKLRPRQ
jgi:hypothetical protein